ncbi:proline-rich protein 15 [Osmerus mordax]|uniref:proline-rich protein 15 n=1 Tax=Osmerus mordax TaxID=8014 RepID=UPI0035100444
MAERVPWWRAFMVKRKSGARDTSASQPQDQEQDPSHSQTGQASVSQNPFDKTQSPTQHQEKALLNSDTNIFMDETYDDSQLEPVFNEQTCRRHMRVSRSGRFKEKRRARTSLPLDEDNQEMGKEDVR